jgi:hypothetical protein
LSTLLVASATEFTFMIMKKLAQKIGRETPSYLPSECAMQRLARRQFPGFFCAYPRRCGQRSCAIGGRGQNRSAAAERGAEASNGAAMISPNFAITAGESRMPFCMMAHQDSAARNLQMHIQLCSVASRIRFVIVSGRLRRAFRISAAEVWHGLLVLPQSF